MRAVPELSVLIVNYNSWRVCVDAVESLREHAPTRPDGTPMPFEVIVVDNASPLVDDEARARVIELVGEVGGEVVLHDENGGYSTGMNLAHGRSRGEWLLVTNPDVVFLPDTIDRLLRHLEAHPDVGAAAPEGYWDLALECRLPPNILPTLGDLWRTTRAGIDPRGVRSYSARRTAEAVRVWTAEQPVDLDMLSGCCFVMRRSFFEAIGCFDERFPLYFEDTDLSVRIRRAGKRIVQVYGSRLVHLYNRSGQTDHGEAMARYWTSKAAYYRKWYGRLGGWLERRARRLLESAWGQRRAARDPQPGLTELPTGSAAPTIELPYSTPRFVVEVSLDPRFYLAAGVLASGDSWTPSELLFKNFGPATYFFRVCDLQGPRPRELAVYRYTREFLDRWVERAEAEAPKPTEPRTS